MDGIQSFEEFLATQSLQIPVGDFAINLVLAAALAYVLRWFYVKHGDALSNRSAFARNFVLITMTTMLIISIVKSSLALSLGLVGALSIIRFRTAVKEPEELSYLFLAIAIGLGMGADQRLITLVAFALILAIAWFMKRASASEGNQNLFLTVSSHNPQKADLGDVVAVLKEHCSAVSLKRFDDSKELLEAAFLVEYDDFAQLESSKAALLGLGDDVRVTFLDNIGLGSG